MRSDGEKQLLVFFNLNLQQKITFLEMIDLHYLTEVSIFYGLKKKKLRNCLKEARLNYTCEGMYLFCVIFVLLVINFGSLALMFHYCKAEADKTFEAKCTLLFSYRYYT